MKKIERIVKAIEKTDCLYLNEKDLFLSFLFKGNYESNIRFIRLYNKFITDKNVINIISDLEDLKNSEINAISITDKAFAEMTSAVEPLYSVSIQLCKKYVKNSYVYEKHTEYIQTRGGFINYSPEAYKSFWRNV